MKKPVALHIVASLFLVAGVLSVALQVHSILTRHPAPVLTVFVLPIGIGLFRLKASSRDYALGWIYFGYLLVLGVFCLGIVPGSEVTWLGASYRGLQAGVIIGVSSLIFAGLLRWMHTVLRRSDVDQLFFYKAFPKAHLRELEMAKRDQLRHLPQSPQC